MSVQSEIARLSDAKADLRTWLASSGAQIPDKATLDDLVKLLPTFATVYTGSGAPDASLGSDGDIYLDLG